MRRVLAAAIATVLTAGLGSMGAVAADAQPALPPAKPRVLAVAASASHVVVTRRTTGKHLVGLAGGSLLARDAAGRETRLPTFSASHELDLAGATLVQATNPDGTFADADGAEAVHYRNLATGVEGRTTLPVGEDLVSAAPGGWVVRTTTGRTEQGPVVTLTKRSISGTTTDLGTPFADGTGFAVKQGEGGLVAYSIDGAEINGRGLVRAMSWTSPGTWITLYHSTSSPELYCEAPSARFVACRDEDGRGLGLLALDHSKNVWLHSAHPSACQLLDFATVGSDLVGVAYSDRGSCVQGRLYRLGSAKALVGSKRTYGPFGLRPGLGGILTAPASQSAVQILTGVTKRPKTLIHAERGRPAPSRGAF